eukprot:5996689-Alexandrium_andersonii.AAC.1
MAAERCEGPAAERVQGYLPPPQQAPGCQSMACARRRRARAHRILGHQARVPTQDQQGQKLARAASPQPLAA